MTSERNNKITLANSLIENHDCMSTNEYRIFFSMLSSVNEKETTIYFELKNENAGIEEELLKELTINKLCSQKRLKIKIMVKELEELWNIPRNKSYEYIKKAASSFRERGMLVERITESGKRKFDTLPYVSRISYEDGSAYIDIEINEVILPYIAALSREYTIFKINNINRLPTSTSIRLYEILKKNQKLIKYQVKLDKLERLMFKNYGSRNMFIKRVIENNVEIINQNTDIFVTYKVSGRGRNSTIEFTILAKKELLLEEKKVNKGELIASAKVKVGEDAEKYVDFILSKIEKKIVTGEVKNIQAYVSAIIENETVIEEFKEVRVEEISKEKKKESELLKLYLDKIHDEAQAELTKRRDLVFMMVPELKAIDEEIVELTREVTMCVLTDHNRAEELRNIIEEKKLMSSELLDQAGFKPEFLEMKYRCNICNDTCIVPDTGATCSCRDERLKEAKALEITIEGGEVR